VIADNGGVVVDFWASYCRPCMDFKPTYEGMAKANQSSRIVFCAVETDKVRDCAQANNIRSIPTFHFYLNGKNHKTFTGANQANFSQALKDLEQILGSKAGQHSSRSFK
jgi:thioredoxin-like negative regulator of GroEL